MKAKKDIYHQNGMVLASILMITIFLSVLAFAIVNFSTINLSRARSRVLLLQTQYASESGADAAIATLNSGNTSYAGTVSDVQVVDNAPYYRATYSVVVSAGADAKEKIITATGKLYSPSSASTPKYTRQIEILAKRSSDTSTTGILSRNILYTDSPVKNVQSKDIFVNGFISLNANVTNLIAEKITVADKNTGAGNCSIGGTGNLIKPSSFTTPGQTKTIINMAFNNCINPPGNTSNADFDITPNLTTISKIQSTYIPWSQYMDGTYQNSPGGCNDWTTGGTTRDIPSTGNAKKTHYPDNSSGVATSCGTSGNLALGTTTFNINEHVHVRANLCGAAACAVTFNNPDSTMKYIFVEGSVRFSRVSTSAGSGPITLIAYGADPSSVASRCPYGGAIFIGNASSTSAPKLYLLSMNGVCLDRTRFSTANGLGGMSGKNVYINSNPGTPFDLALDPSFPVNEIPVDLSFKATRYRRL